MIDFNVGDKVKFDSDDIIGTIKDKNDIAYVIEVLDGKTVVIARANEKLKKASEATVAGMLSHAAAYEIGKHNGKSEAKEECKCPDKGQ